MVSQLLGPHSTLPCVFTHSVVCRLLRLHDTLPCVLIILHIILLYVHSLKLLCVKLHTTLSRDMIVLLDNVQILVIRKKLVNKLRSVGLITLLWLSVTQWITNKISNFVTCSNNLIKNSLTVKKGVAPKRLW